MIRKTQEGWWIIAGDSHIGKWVEESGQLSHDQNALPIILKHAPVGGVVVDAGAYCGDHTIAYLNKVGPTGKVFAFEPNPEAFECLCLNCQKALCYKWALSDKDGWGSLIQPTDRNYGTCSVSNATDGGVKLMPLDALELERLDLLKADVEAGEYNLLLGAADTIRRCRPIMVIEINESALRSRNLEPENLMALIKSMRYEVGNLYPRHECSGPMFDVLCLPSDRQPPQP